MSSLDRVLLYLRETHGSDSLRPWYSDEQWSNIVEEDSSSVYTSDLLKPMGVDYTPSWRTSQTEDNGEKYFYLSQESSQYYGTNSLSLEDITSYDWYGEVATSREKRKVSLTSSDQTKISYQWTSNNDLEIQDSSGRNITLPVESKVEEALNNNASALNFTNGDLSTSNEDFRVKLLIYQVSGYEEDGEIVSINNLEARLFLEVL